MNEIGDKFLLARDKFMFEMHLRELDLHILLVDHLLKIKKDQKIQRNRKLKIYLSKRIR